MEIKEQFIQVFVTTNDRTDAKNIGKAVLEEQLAGCIQIIGPMTSMFWWADKIEEDQEYLVLIKSESSRFAEIEEAINKNHAYEVPEILSMPVAEGNEDYLDWLRTELRKGKI